MCVRKLCPLIRKEKNVHVCVCMYVCVCVCAYMCVSGCSTVGHGTAVAAQKTLVCLLH